MTNAQPINVIVAIHPGLFRGQPQVHKRIADYLAEESGCKLVELIHPVGEIEKLDPRPRRIVIMSSSEFWEQSLMHAIISNAVVREIPRTVIPIPPWERNHDANLAALVRIVCDPTFRES